MGPWWHILLWLSKVCKPGKISTFTGYGLPQPQIESRPHISRHFTDIMQLPVFSINQRPWQNNICNTPSDRVTVPHQTALRGQPSQHGILGHIAQVAVMLLKYIRAISALHSLDHFDKHRPEISFCLIIIKCYSPTHLSLTWHFFLNSAKCSMMPL